MKYTRHFGGVIRNQGVPSLSNDCFTIFMNIVHLEGSINGLNNFKIKAKDTSDFYKYDVEIAKYGEKLNDLIKGLEPNELLQKLVSDSYSS
ncbi:hypothetical protein [Seonamhaeicola marinus]|uniref:Uncharacterized protein n=1 Tax=Seonamhaeicola marinus TaxID=1912246 RepID=A0A5D0HVT2_9FLAO|nr:hypothetical protein [Seonamhaeicola marinus]TYA74227.1 hypothetical protein FUA24_12910 [Seonamhaeicola marinus]